MSITGIKGVGFRLRQEEGTALLGAVVFSLLLAMLALGYLRWGGYAGQAAAVRLRAAQALLCADSGVEWSRYFLQDAANWHSWRMPQDPGESGIPVGGLGEFRLDFVYAANSGRGVLTSIGTYAGVSRKVVCELYFKVEMNWNNGVGAFSGPIKITGNMVMDGRNHRRDEPFEVLPGGGTATIAIETGYDGIEVPYSAARFAGTDEHGLDYPLQPWSQDALAPIVEVEVEVPDTPDEVVEFSVPLYQLAQENGALYTRHPGNGKEFQLKPGVNYVALPEDKSVWHAPHFVPPPGNEAVVLVVHNGAYTATLEELHGLVPGLVIADKVVRIHGTILGALVTLAADPMQVGSGNGRLLFCREVLMELWQRYGEDNQEDHDDHEDHKEDEDEEDEEHSRAWVVSWREVVD